MSSITPIKLTKPMNAQLSWAFILVFLLITFLLITPSCSPTIGRKNNSNDYQGSERTNKTSVTIHPSSSPTRETVEPSPRSDKLEKYLKEGEMHLNENKLKEAVQVLTKAIELAPEDYKAYDIRSMAYYNLGEHRKGLADCNKAIAIAKKDGSFETKCPRGVLARRGAHYFNLNDTDKAIEDFHTVIRYAPDFAFAYYDLGQCYFKKGEYKIATDYFKKAIKLNEDERITRSARIYLEKIKGLNNNKEL